MPDYAGAKAAIAQRLIDNWAVTPITRQNKIPDDPWPPTEPNPDAPDFPQLAPWVHLEIFTLPGGGIYGAGTPGKQIWQTDGFIYVHVFVPSGTGDELATQYAATIGEIFRAKVFYENGDGCYVRTWAPRVDEGGPATTSTDIEWANTGNWFRVTMSCPFEYWHRG
jgi:hypothetical protein